MYSTVGSEDRKADSVMCNFHHQAHKIRAINELFPVISRDNSTRLVLDLVFGQYKTQPRTVVRLQLWTTT